MKPILSLCVLVAGSLAAKDTSEAVSRLREANTVLQEVMAAPDKGIPDDLLSKAHCAVIVPAVKRGGFIVGAHYGKGVMLCRQPGGNGWTGPSTVRLEGGSVGLQIGGSETDVVLLVMNKGGAEKLMRSEFKIGADASAAAGPVGRSTEASTDAHMKAEILSWSRSRGVFAGLALNGSTVRSDDSDNRVIYGRSVSHQDILQGKVTPPPVAQLLRSTLSRYSPREESN